MADLSPTVSELFTAKAVTDDEVTAAIEAAILAAMRSHGDAVYVADVPIFDGRYRLDGFFDISAIARAAMRASQDRAR